LSEILRKIQYTAAQNLLILILCLSCALRIFGIGSESFWNDELSSMTRSSYSNLQEVVELGVVPDVHPPGYQIFLFFIENTLGNSEIALRFPSAIAGVLTVLVTYLIGKKLSSRRTALLGSAMLAVSPVHIWLSQEARPYAVLILLTALSVYLLVCYLKRDQDNQGTGLLFFMAVTFILLEYLHYFGLLIYALAGGCLLIHSVLRKQNRLLVVLSLLVPALAYIPWIPVMLAQSAGNSYIEPPGMMSIVYLFIEYMGWSKLLLAVFALLFVPTVRSFIRGAVSYKKGFATFILWIVTPMSVSIAVSLLATPVFTSRNMMVALPAVLLLQALCITEGIEDRKSGNLIGLAVLLLMVFQLVFVRKHYTEPHRNQFREAAYYTVEHVADPEKAIILTSAWNNAYFDYYFQRCGSGISTDLQAVSDQDFPDVKELITGMNPEEVWLLWGHIQPDSSLVDSISAMFSDAEYQPLLGAGVWRFSGRKQQFCY